MTHRILLIICVLFSFKLSAFGQDANPEAQALYDQALVAKEDGSLLKARENLEKLLFQFHDFPQIGQVKEEWRQVMWRIIQSNAPSSEAVLYEVRSGDTLEKIAKQHGTTVELIKKRNRLVSDMIRLGQKLSVWHRPFIIFVNKTRNILILNLGGEAIKAYYVSTGKADATTPEGEFTIQYRYPNPTWFHKGKVVAPSSPENWLGTRWLGFNKPKYGIHGTIYPKLIGQSVSGGCVRMKNEDVQELYDLVPVGTKVFINQ